MEIIVKKKINEQYVSFAYLMMLEFFEYENKLFIKTGPYNVVDVKYQDDYKFDGAEITVQVNKLDITYEINYDNI